MVSHAGELLRQPVAITLAYQPYSETIGNAMNVRTTILFDSRDRLFVGSTNTETQDSTMLTAHKLPRGRQISSVVAYEFTVTAGDHASVYLKSNERHAGKIFLAGSSGNVGAIASATYDNDVLVSAEVARIGSPSSTGN